MVWAERDGVGKERIVRLQAESRIDWHAKRSDVSPSWLKESESFTRTCLILKLFPLDSLLTRLSDSTAGAGVSCRVRIHSFYGTYAAPFCLHYQLSLGNVSISRLRGVLAEAAITISRSLTRCSAATVVICSFTSTYLQAYSSALIKTLRCQLFFFFFSSRDHKIDFYPAGFRKYSIRLIHLRVRYLEVYKAFSTGIQRSNKNTTLSTILLLLQIAKQNLHQQNFGNFLKGSLPYVSCSSLPLS